MRSAEISNAKAPRRKGCFGNLGVWHKGNQVREVTALMAEKLGWDAAEQVRQVAEYTRQVALTRSFRTESTKSIRADQ